MAFPRRSAMIMTTIVAGIVAGMAGPLSEESRAADKVQIEQAVERGKQYLLSQNQSMAAGSLACYSLVKAGVAKDHPVIKQVVAEVVGKCRSNGYVPGAHHNYEAGVDAMLLEAIDKEFYKPQLELIAQYLVGRQRPHGGWYYPNENASTDFGDTSITQYAVLGLWAAVRADVEVPVETWERVARWLMITQHQSGGFGYHPQNSAGGPIIANDTTGTMSVAGTGSLLVVRHVLFHDAVPVEDEDQPVVTPLRRFGVLERLPDAKVEKKPKQKSKAVVTAGAFEKSVKEGVRWTSDHFGEPGALGTYANYYFYGVERVAALLEAEKLGTHDWYHEGADYLLRKQAADGSWNDSCGVGPATSLTLLFLTKATAGVINRPPRKKTPMVGGGLLIGGRGLPENLDAVKVKEGEVSRRKTHGSMDGLLAELEKSSGAKVEAAQEAVVEAVQLDHPEDLIGQVDRLKRLSADKRLEVRRTAMWALGRTGQVSVAPLLIQGLSDVDESVAREASVALCILSRRPNGCGLPIDPGDGLAEDATDDQRRAFLDAWRKDSSKAWNDWYMKVRPYNERDDRATLKRKP